MFTKIILDYDNNLFPELADSTEFEDVARGRKGAVLVQSAYNLTTLVRTTTKYNKPPQVFEPIHCDIIEKMREKTGIDLLFNNALIEIYDDRYQTMGFHSDQALDLADNSYIAIYSCYENPNHTDSVNLRKLVVMNKLTQEISEFLLEHNSVILFNLSTNQNYLHKIILENSETNNRWLGITFRSAKTLIHHINNAPYFYKTNIELKLANNDECKQFYKLRSEENKKTTFSYPEIIYTISPSDLLKPKLIKNEIKSL